MRHRPLATALLAGLIAAGPAVGQTVAKPAEPETADATKQLIVRVDDIGFCHAANMAFERVAEAGGASAVSVIVNTPWLDEAVEIIRRHPEISVGVHLCLNSEWREYRWGPVLPHTEVPSLVDEDGKFFGTRRDLMANRPKVAEVAKELRAQIELARRKGLPICYLDYHMGAALSTREFQEVVEQLAAEYELGISRYFGEREAPAIYRVPPAEKPARGVEIVRGLSEPGLYLMVVHPGLNTPEMAALTDLNITGVSPMAAHRQAETDMLCAPAFRETIAEAGLTLVGYDALKARGLDRMERPWTADPYELVLKRAESP